MWVGREHCVAASALLLRSGGCLPTSRLVLGCDFLILGHRWLIEFFLHTLVAVRAPRWWLARGPSQDDSRGLLLRPLIVGEAQVPLLPST